MELLIANKAEVNAKTSNGSTPLYSAAQNGHKDVVKLLIANKAEVNVKASNGSTPLHIAAQNGHEDVVESLRQHGWLRITQQARHAGYL